MTLSTRVKERRLRRTWDKRQQKGIPTDTSLEETGEVEAEPGLGAA